MWNKCLPSGALYQALLTTKMNLDKVLEQKVQFVKFQSVQFSSSSCLPLYFVVFIPFENVLSRYFYVSLNLVAVPAMWSLINSVTQLLGLSYWNDLLWFLTVTVECWKGPRSVSIPTEALLKRLSSVFFVWFCFSADSCYRCFVFA